MPVIQGSQSIAANATVENLIAGSQFEFSPFNATVEFAVVAAAVGVVADISTGADVIAESMSVSNANRFPILPDDFIAIDITRTGERIKLRVRNTTGAAIVVNFCVRIMPMGG